jgi:hypothetical protein
MSSSENPRDIALICNICITLVFIVILLITLLTNKSCPQVKIVEPTKPKTQSVPVEDLLKNLEEQENFTLPEKLQIQKNPTQVEIEKDRQLLILLLKDYLEKQKKEGNKNPYISINDLKTEIKYSLKNSGEILNLLDESINNIENTAKSSLDTTSPPVLN